MVELPGDDVNLVSHDVDHPQIYGPKTWSYDWDAYEDTVSKGEIQELKEIKVYFYEPCVFGKHKRVMFAKLGRMSKAKKLELVII